MPAPYPQIAAVLDLVDKKLSGDRKALFQTIIPAYWALVAPEELQALKPDDLLAICERHVKLAGRRKVGHPLVKVSTSRGGDEVTVEAVVDDMPFLFDSLSNTLHNEGYTILLANHPVLWVKRSGQGQLEDVRTGDPGGTEAGLYRAESWMRLALEPGAQPKPARELEKRIREVLAQVRTVVTGWEKMRSKAAEIRFRLEKPHQPVDETERRQACEFLGWIENNNFTFISYIHAALEDSDGKPRLKPVAKSRLGLKIDASPWHDLAREGRHEELLQEYLRSISLLLVTKSSQLSPVHRNAYLDYVAVKEFDGDGNTCGEHRFFGLFTRAAYNSRALDIPLLANRINTALARANFLPASHNAKALQQILETLPRDEQFQSSADELYETAMGVLALEERNRVRVFCRIDVFRRFYSFLMYIPRDRYSQKIREHIQRAITDVTGSTDMSFRINLTESALAQLQLNVRVPPGTARGVDITSLEHEVERITQSWHESLRFGLQETYSHRHARELYALYDGAFSEAYIAKIAPTVAVNDIVELEELRHNGESIRVRLLPELGHDTNRLQVRAYFSDHPVALADVQPRLANLGLRLLVEDLYPIDLGGGAHLWIQDFRVDTRLHQSVDLNVTAPLFEEAFVKIHNGRIEDDWFNALILAANIDCREAGLLRAYSRYLKQLGIRFGQIYISEILAGHGHIARLLVELFVTRFRPGVKSRDQKQSAVDGKLLEALDAVTSLDADRILRSFRSLMLATLRTNYFQLDADGQSKETFVFKLLPENVPDAPRPRPKYEIWVHSPLVEAVHLRGDKVARGGLRWSDRPEDFRTEVLGLFKAQMVKNAVIVPVGAKGGFVCRRLPQQASREEIQAHVIECYRTFVGGMLDITDNLDGDKVVRPPRTVCHDDEDPYLVVAADKGTATFSDIANDISASYNFWIGDAFASGGSNGYDHKKMGITARGGWESVKRHFREMGKNIQEEDFTVVGIGDMAGDVFGNGMLLSKHIQLVAAFNHQHIFIDPAPDAATSWKERSRLFALPRSSWEDYDRKKLSKGGAIYSRGEKSIKPSREACEALDLPQKSYAPDELIHEILKAPVELLWNGGIGTYVKAEQESHEQVGDRVNDALRVNGNELRCRVIGEGGNLGLTQMGRVEYSLHGGHCNTDFIDNSGGVDSSDAEVNIKIALNAAVVAGKITFEQRNKLLRDMTEEVKNAVLRNNYLQTQAISMLASYAQDRLGEQAELIRLLERDGVLDRKLEMLPDEKNIQQRQSAGLGLTRPEMATLLSYAKIDLYRSLVHSDTPEDPYLSRELEKYFPKPLRTPYHDFIQRHRLRREIICTSITNSLVNRMGTAFARRLSEEMGCSMAEIARAYTVARDAFGIRGLWRDIEGLDNKVPAQMQLDVLMDIRRLLRHVTLWLLNNEMHIDNIESVVTRLQADVALLEKNAYPLLSDHEKERTNNRIKNYTDQGFPQPVAKRITLLKALYPAPDINWLSRRLDIGSDKVAEVYFKLADKLDLIWIRRKIDRLAADTRWHALARNALRDDLYLRQRHLTDLVLRQINVRQPIGRQLEHWYESNRYKAHYLTDLVAELKTADHADYLSLSVVLRQLGRLAM